ncbi:MAG: heme o synthase [Verrucomicrobiales bacterium]
MTKARLSLLVVLTTLVGFVLASREGIDGILLLHTIVGSALAAFGAAVFNQVMEIEQDARMRRTADRPLPMGRIPPAVAFGIGWMLSALGVVHLGMMVNINACLAAAFTLVLYLFVYTPMKRRSSWNTVVGAVAGALPPLIGWFGAGGGYDLDALFLFLLLFFWQLPHFVAINWIYREDYESAGFVMWSNADVTGLRTARLATAFSAMLSASMILPWISGSVGGLTLGGILLPSLYMVYLSVLLLLKPDRKAARRLFLYTLLYLPIVCGVLIIGWR